MATTYRTSTPLIQRIQNDGVFGAGLPDNQLSTESKLANSMQGTFNAFRSGMGPQTDFGAINTAANQPTYDTSFIGGTPSLANMGLHPSGGPTTSYAPDDLRARAIAAGGAPVTGFGGVTVTASPNAQGGTGFSLMQAGIAPGASSQGMIDPNPTPAAMEFLRTGVAPANPGAFPRIGGDFPQVAAPSQSSPFQQPSNAMFQQQAPQGGLGNYLPKGPPEQVKAQLGVMKTIQDMQQAKIEQAAVVAAHQPGVDGLTTYLRLGGKDPAMINSFKKDAQSTAALNLKKDAATQKQADAASAQDEKVRQATESADFVIGNVDKIIPQVDKFAPGILAANARSAASKVRGSDMYNLQALIDPIKANVGIDQLQAMRAASKTGASGFGQLSEKELDVLQKSVGNLDLAQDPAQLKEALLGVKNHFQAWKMSFEAGKKAADGTLSPQEHARAILAIREANKTSQKP